MFTARRPVLLLATLLLLAGCSNQDHPLRPGDSGNDPSVLHRGEVPPDPFDVKATLEGTGMESVQVGDYVVARGEYRTDPDRLAMSDYEVRTCDGSGDEGCPQNDCWGRLNGPVTHLDLGANLIEVMGTPVLWIDKAGGDRGYDWSARVRLDVAQDDDGSLVACRFPLNPKRWDEVRGYVQEVVLDAAGGVAGVVVLNTLVVFPGADVEPDPPLGVISGLVWNDLDGDGVRDTGEGGLPNVAVTLAGDAGATTTTGPDGSFRFEMLAAGSYEVASLGPDGWSPTTGSPVAVVLADNASVFDAADFGWREDVVEPTGAISGLVWNDLDGDGVRDAGEGGLAGITVILSGAADATATTGPDGAYGFTALSAGDYVVASDGPGGWSPTTATPAAVSLPTDDATAAGVDFGWREPSQGGTGIISGVVFDDANGNGVRDAGEAGLAGMTVELTGAAAATATTSSEGVYMFLLLGAGGYTVTCAGPAGGTSTTGPVTVLLLTDFDIVTGADLGWREQAAP